MFTIVREREPHMYPHSLTVVNILGLKKCALLFEIP